MKHPIRTPRLDLNASSADRWTACTASPAFILANADKIPPDDGTKWSEEGTSAHEVAAAYLLNREPGKTPTPVDADMRWNGWTYMDFVESLREVASLLYVEQKLPLWYMPERNAIVDAAVVNPDSLHIVDYKYGEGVSVHPEGNLQATIYAHIIGLPLKLARSHPVFVHIYQPRGRSPADLPLHTWETTWGEIERIADIIKSKADMIIVGSSGVEFAPSEKACQFCPAKGFCSARQSHLTGEIEALAVVAPTFPLAATISIFQLAAILKHKNQLVKWLNDAGAYALSMMKAGGTIPGFKLVMSRGGHRYWTDPKAAAELLMAGILKRSEVIEEKVISPPAAEKLIGKLPVDLLNLVARPSGQMVIAPVEDRREAVGDYADEFEDLTSAEDF